MTAPTVHDWIGGSPALEALTAKFYARVANDPVLAPVFETMGPEHPRHVAAFLGEVLGGPPAYSEAHGGHAAMVRHHLGRHLTEPQRRRWMALLQDAYADLGLPSDPEVMSALVGYLEWGSRLAVSNSAPGAKAQEAAPMPRWGWGETGGPWQPKGRQE